MNTTANGRALARSRANQRLRNLTIGTAVFGIAATGGLGWLAAISYDGSSAATTTAAVLTTADTPASAATDTPASATTTPSAAPVVSTAGGSGHAITGGS